VDLVWFNDVSDNAEDAERLRSALSALELKHTQLSDVLDAAPFPVWIRDGELNLQWVNAAYMTAVEGQSVARVLRKQIELCSSAVAGSSREFAGRAIKDLQTRSERQSVVTGGERRTLEVIDVPLGGSGDGLVGFAIDVTEAEHTRSELNLHLESQAETLNKLSAPVAIFAGNSRLEFYNSAFAQLWRLSEDWLNEKPRHSELLETLRENRSLPEQTDFPAWKAKTLAYYTGILEPVEEMWHLPDDKTLRVVTQPHPLGGLLVIFEDVTDRLALERSYNTLIAVQRETIDNLHEAVVVVGGDLRIKLFNQNYAAVWGLSEDVLTGEPHIGDVIDECSPLLADSESGREAAKKKMIGHSISRETNSGRWSLTDGRILEFATVPLPDGASLTTVNDVTATHRVEQALRDKNEALEAADQLKSEFVANMSYELRTPLNSILGFSEILENQYFGGLNEQQSEYVEGIILSSRQLRDLIDDILDLAVVEAGQVDLDLSEFDLAEAVGAVVAIAQDQAHRKNIDIRIRMKNQPGLITGDKRRIKHAIYNIVQNAIGYTQGGGTITISAKGDARQVSLEVTDTGVGITPGEQANIFDKFQRGSNSEQAPHGVGLGLALVRSFIEVHGGSVELESEPDKGTTVKIQLPRTPASGTRPETPPDDGDDDDHGPGVVSLAKRRRA
jgi:signal transduction histidine kinase